MAPILFFEFGKEKEMISETWEWCLTPHKEDEIRERVLTDYKDICFDYLCSYSKMTDEFKIELAVLSLGKTGNSDVKPYITKDNYEALYPVFKAAYLWVYGGCTGKAIPELFECLQIMGFEKRLKTRLEGSKHKVVKLRKSLQNAEAILTIAEDDLKKEEGKKKPKPERIKKLTERRDEQKKRLDQISINIENTEKRIDMLEETIKAFDILMSKKKVTSDFLKDELIGAFTDRLPTTQVWKGESK